MNKNNSDLQVRNILLKSLRGGSNITAACQAAEISRTTFYGWRIANKEFDASVEKAKLSRVQIVEDALYKNALEGSTHAQVFYLKNRGNWADKDKEINIESHYHFTTVVEELHATATGTNDKAGKGTRDISSLES